MSELEVSDPLPEQSEVEHSSVVTAGGLIRNAREAAGLHIAALAVSMKVPVKKLEALEADRADLLPDAVFVRALASSVCRALKIDSAPVLDLLPKTIKPSFEAGSKGINAPFRVPGEVGSGGIIEGLKRPVVIVVAILLLAASGVVLLPEVHLSDLSTSSDAVTVPVLASKEPPLEAATLPEKSEEKVQLAEVVSGPSPIESVQQPAAGLPLPESSAPVVKQADLIVIRAKGTTWVEVVDSTGAVLIRRTLQADGVTAATGVTPLAVVVGKADTVDVEVRGKPFSLTSVSKDNVARFEVK